MIDDDASLTNRDFTDNNDIVTLAETHRGGNLRDLVWLRPSDIYTIDGRQYRWSVLHDPKSSDIIQGHLGNCWFLSALAVIAERKELLEKIMITKVYQQNGVYLLYLCIDGLWQSILVDDFLPCDKNSRKQVFAQARKNQLWIPLIEKAFAKVYGSYGKLTAGRTIEGFSVLCGCPVKELDITSLKNEENGGLEMIWAKMASANEAGFLLGASCGSRSNADNSAEYKRVGLLSNHAYSLLDCIALPDGRRVLRVRNPWGGNFVWNQEWSEKWSGWTPELKNILKFKSNTNDGSFYMPFEAFCYYFDAVDIAKIRKNWKELRIPLKIENNWCSPNLQALKVIVTHDTEATFVLYQNESRKKPDNHDIFMLVHKEDSTHGGPGRLVAATSRKLAAFTSTDDIFLTAGIYFVTYFSFTKFSNNSPPLNGVVTIHSSKSMKASFTLVSPAFYHESLAVYVKK
uniref:Calpain catalytic domain-containing protein n=1 Tax=Rhabditophanes sp. KR3021 TaxID=114890 RepID=A0AC35U2M2_9BILA